MSIAMPPFTSANFWATVAKSDGCWLWKGKTTPLGYGTVRFEGRQWQAHRLAYALVNGAIGAGLHVCHKCDVRACVNPSHLCLGTAKDNMHDMIAKGCSTPGALHVPEPGATLEQAVAEIRQHHALVVSALPEYAQNTYIGVLLQFIDKQEAAFGPSARKS